ncbi:hypothetical protein [Halobacterium sp. CBA1126]|uniref:hypothetical protein n=1 Tax=Halobacterium sp. CBA1126 TaxID=2668074 RepID=UPI0012FCEDDB|nr:hypothetical protein [Halobacterium sp. CBA1126]MUV61712.1 hypothetical protein [Halobacterium sp. CBA1126]
MRPALHVAAVALVVLAGCNGVGPAPGTERPPEPTYPPGVTADGVSNATALVDAHREHVVAHGAVVRSNSTTAIRIAGEVRAVETTATARATPDLTRIHVVSRGVRVSGNETTAGRFEVYANETTVLRRMQYGNETSVRAESRDGGAPLVVERVVQAQHLRGALDSLEFAVVDTERRDDRTVTTLSADETTLSGDAPSRNAATLEVAASGRVLSLSVTRDRNTTTPVGRRTLDVTWADATTVEPPEWVQTRRQ